MFSEILITIGKVFLTIKVKKPSLFWCIWLGPQEFDRSHDLSPGCHIYSCLRQDALLILVCSRLPYLFLFTPGCHTYSCLCWVALLLFVLIFISFRGYLPYLTISTLIYGILRAISIRLHIYFEYIGRFRYKKLVAR